ncbi:MAG: hypothetical protein ABR878_05395 [Roseiarcus sp.]|jgi:hypothetical protein
MRNIVGQKGFSDFLSTLRGGGGANFPMLRCNAPKRPKFAFQINPF